jgi:hypothetical protein
MAGTYRTVASREKPAKKAKTSTQDDDDKRIMAAMLKQKTKKSRGAY